MERVLEQEKGGDARLPNEDSNEIGGCAGVSHREPDVSSEKTCRRAGLERKSRVHPTVRATVPIGIYEQAKEASERSAAKLVPRSVQRPITSEIRVKRLAARGGTIRRKPGPGGEEEERKRRGKGGVGLRRGRFATRLIPPSKNSVFSVRTDFVDRGRKGHRIVSKDSRPVVPPASTVASSAEEFVIDDI
ncbi:hypothetical protein KM043_001996 [Ampulex compressa]|nr:hypothetical protein KM043_001996 [Ampulex compressa]